jgi:hypothetical protein
VLIVAGRAAAAETLAVVDLVTPPTMVALGGQITNELLRSAREQKLVVIPPEDVKRAVDEGRYGELLRCDGAPECVAAKLAEHAPSRTIGGRLDRTETDYELRLWQVDVRQRKTVVAVTRRIPIASRRLFAEVQAMVPFLVRGQLEPEGTLRAEADLETVKVFLNGADAGLTPLKRSLPPGEHALRFEKDGFLPVERTVSVRSGAQAEVAVRMLPAPLTPEDAKRPPVTKTEVQRPGGLRVPGVALAAFVGGAAAAGTGVGYLVASNSAGQRGDVALAEQRTKLSNALFIGAGAAVAVGLGLTLWETIASASGPAEPTGPKVTLGATPVHGGGVVFAAGTFAP